MSITHWTTLLAVVALTVLLPDDLSAADDPPAGNVQPLLEKAVIDEIVGPFLKDKSHIGLVVGTTQPQKSQVFGYGTVKLQAKQQTPAEDTIFEIGSITKTFTGVLLAEQVLAGTMRLDDPVQKYLPEELRVPRRDDRDITLLHLATHTSSLPIQPPVIGLFALGTKDPGNPYAEYRLSNLKGTLSTMQLPHPIGSKFAYSNLGVGLLGHAVAGAGKAGSWEELMIQRIAQPLGLADTRAQLNADQLKRLAPGFSSLGLPASPWTFGCLDGCGVLRSTTRDMLTYVEANLGRRETVLKAAFQLAHQPWREIGQPQKSVGLCWMSQKLGVGNRIVLWHNGGTGGYRSFLGFVPDANVGVVLLSNSTHSVDSIGMEILNVSRSEIKVHAHARLTSLRDRLSRRYNRVVLVGDSARQCVGPSVDSQPRGTRAMTQPVGTSTCLLWIAISLGVAAPASAQPSVAEQAKDPARFLESARKLLKWDEPAEPAHMAGPLYFVGTKGLSVFLITSPEGHIVLNTGMPGSGPMIEKSIRKLGFKPEDVKYLLAGHAHCDHVGGHAYLQKLTGAKVGMIREEKELYESGGKLDFHYGKIKEFAFEPTRVDLVFKDGDEIKLGDVTLLALLTAGHTRGSTTFLMKIVDKGQTYSVLFPNGTSVNPGYRLAKDPSYPGIAADFRRTYGILEGLEPDIWLYAHNETHAYEAKLARSAKEGTKAWVDLPGYKKWVALQRARFDETLAAESK